MASISLQFCHILSRQDSSMKDHFVCRSALNGQLRALSRMLRSLESCLGKVSSLRCQNLYYSLIIELNSFPPMRNSCEAWISNQISQSQFVPYYNRRLLHDCSLQYHCSQCTTYFTTSGSCEHLLVPKKSSYHGRIYSSIREYREQSSSCSTSDIGIHLKMNLTSSSCVK